jgi:hypothetical protein
VKLARHADKVEHLWTVSRLYCQRLLGEFHPRVAAEIKKNVMIVRENSGNLTRLIIRENFGDFGNLIAVVGNSLI